MKYLKYAVFGLGVAAGLITYQAIEDGRIGALALIGIILITAIVTTLVENKTENK